MQAISEPFVEKPIRSPASIELPGQPGVVHHAMNHATDDLGGLRIVINANEEIGLFRIAVRSCKPVSQAYRSGELLLFDNRHIEWQAILDSRLVFPGAEMFQPRSE